MTAGESLLQAAVECGAKAGAVIGTEDIVLSAQFRDICEKNQCGRYGTCWQCPPDCGDIYVLMDKVRSYPNAVIFQSVGTLEDSFDIEGMQAAAA